EADPAMTKLATTAGLTNKLAFDLALVANHLAIGNLRLTDVCLDTEFATHTVYDDVQVQLTHTTDDGLAGFLVGAHAEGRVFLSQATQRDTHLLLVSLGFRLDGYVDNRLREVHTLKDDRIGDVAQGVTGGDVLHADQGSDVACTHFLDFLTIVGMHLHHTTNALLLALDRVDDGVTRGQNTGVDANEGQSTNEGVSCNLERQRRERRFVGRFALVDFLLVIRVNTLDRRHFVRSRQEFDHGIENKRHTLVLERGAQSRRHDFTSDGALTQSLLDFLDAQLTPFEVLVHQLFIGLGCCLDQIGAILLSLGLQLGRDLFLTEGHALVVLVPVDGLHLDQIDLTDEVFLGTDLQLQRHRSVAQALLDLLDDAQEVGALAVHLRSEERRVGKEIMIELS